MYKDFLFAMAVTLERGRGFSVAGTGWLINFRAAIKSIGGDFL